MRDFDNEIRRIKNNAPDEEDAEEQIRRYVSSIIIAYIRTFENPLDGWMASYQIAKSIGLRDFPKPELETIREGIPTSTIAPPLSSIDLDSMSEDYTIRTPRSSFTESTEEEEEMIPRPPPGRPSGNPPESVRRIRRLRERDLQGSGYNTPGLVKIYKLKK